MIAAALAEQGVEVPEDLLPPDVWAIAEPYRAAFGVLSAARGQGMNGLEAIVYSEIVAYAERNGYAQSIDELEEFVMLIQEQDREFLKATAPKTATAGARG
jgi:hypothetical protein